MSGRRSGGPETAQGARRYRGHDDLFSSNVLLVTGKGGVGKTTTSAALALAAADSGRDTLVVEVEGRHSLSRAFATEPFDYTERAFRPGLWGVSLDPAEAVYDYLELFYGLRRLQWMMERSHALDFVTTAAPGLRDLLLIGKVYEIEARRRADGRRRFDTIVVDAPPTGRIVPFLQSPTAVTEIVRMGPIKRQAGQISRMLTDPARCRAVVVSLPEDMPATEAVEGVAAMSAAGIAVGPVVANQVAVPTVTADDDAVLVDAPDRVAAAIAPTGLDLSEADLAAMATSAGQHRRRVVRQARVVARLRDATTRPLLFLPDLATATFDPDALHVLADTIARQVGADGPSGVDVGDLADASEPSPSTDSVPPDDRRDHRRESAPTSTGLASAVGDAGILVTTGAGGVGKTTIAAALGVAAARDGRTTLVITIDPAKRLAQALGLEGLASRPQEVPLEAPGRLDAMMLDMQSTFDDLVDRHATSPERAATIKDNRIYRSLSGSLSGTQEYMAMEKLHELHDRGEWDLIVVDTPPTRSALDFLDAPARMTSFLEGRLLRLLLQPAVTAGRGYLRAVNVGAAAFMRVAGKVTGMAVLDDIAEFFRAFDGMYDGFKQRAEEVLALLRQPESQFVVVASPQPPPLREARFFVDRLEQEGLHLAGVVVNRLHHGGVDRDADELGRAADLLASAAGPDDDPPARHAAGAGLRVSADLRTIARREARDVAAALVNRSVPAVVRVGRRAGEVTDLSGLTDMAADLTGPIEPTSNA